MFPYAVNVGKMGTLKVLNNHYSITVEEFENIKIILANKYKKCIENGFGSKEIKKELDKKMSYFKQEGFFDFYQIKTRKKNFVIVVNCDDSLYEIELKKE